MARQFYTHLAQDLEQAKAELEDADSKRAPYYRERIRKLEAAFRSERDKESETGDPVLDELMRRQRAGEDVDIADVIAEMGADP